MPKEKVEGAGVPHLEKPLLLDTHVAVWLREGNSRLTPIFALLESSFQKGQICLSPISAWEIGLLVAKKRLDLGQAPLVWFASFADKFNVNILDITPEIAICSSFLPGKLHGDPADRILVATAMTYSAAIVTGDKNIAAYGKKGIVEVIAC